MKRNHSVIASGIGILTLALLVGVSAPASAAPPVSSINLTCKKLASAVNPQASFPVAIHQHNSGLLEETVYGGIPDANQVQMAGGLDCDYSNGIELDASTDNGAVGVRVEYLPYSAAGYWQWLGVAPGTAPSENFGCVMSDPSSDSCQFMSAAGGAWLFVQTVGANSEAVAEDLSHRISVALELGHKTPYVSPVYAHAIPSTCATVIRPSVWRAAVHAPGPVAPFHAPPGWGPDDSARLVNGGVSCTMYNSDETHSVGTIETLPGGRWAFALLRGELTTPGALTPISVPTMRSGDAAFTRCDALHAHCFLDALIATHWVEIDLWTAHRGGDWIRTDRLAAATPLLTEIVHQIYTP